MATLMHIYPSAATVYYSTSSHSLPISNAPSSSLPTEPKPTMSPPTTTPSRKQLTLFVTFHIQPSLISEFKTAHRPVWLACAREPECLLFDVFQNPAQPGRFRFIEVWNASREWFEREQLTKSYYATLWEKSKPTWEREVEIEYFEREGEGCRFRRGYLGGGECMD